MGYTLDELPNPITTRKKVGGQQSAVGGEELLAADRRPPTADYELYTSACFEPTIDYVVVKIPRWTFEKFPDADETLTTQMKSVGEAMAIGRTFKEALQKGIRSMEVKRFGFGLDGSDKWLNASNKTGVATSVAMILAHSVRHAPPQARRAFAGAAVLRALRAQDGLDDRAGARAHAQYDPWFPRADEGADRLRRQGSLKSTKAIQDLEGFGRRI